MNNKDLSMKKMTVTMIIALGLTVSANATPCIEAIDNTPVGGLSLQPISVSEVTKVNKSACVDGDSVVTSHISTFKGSASKVEVTFGNEEIGIDY